MKIYKNETWTWIENFAIVIVTNTKNDEQYFKIFEGKEFEEDQENCFELVAKKGSKLDSLDELQDWIKEKI